MAAAVAALVTMALLPGRAEASDTGQFLALTNSVRTAHGLAPLVLDSQLAAVGQRWAETLAARGSIAHNTSLPQQVAGWKILGENVGVGGTVESVHNAWVASPTHYKNLVEPAFTKVGFGIVRPDARIFVVQVFMLPLGSPAGATPAASPTTAPKAAPAAAGAAVPATSAPVRATRIVPAPPEPVVAQRSPWMAMVHSLDRLRSMDSALAAS